MKKALLSAILVTATGTAFAQVANDDVITGAGYANQVFYSLDNDEQKTSPKNDWDLAFELKNITSSIHINTVTGIGLWVYPKANASGWSGTIDTSDKHLWGDSRYNSDSTWREGAMGRYANPADQTDLDWGKYNLSTHTVTGDSIYIIALPNGSVKKLLIESLASGRYTFKYADLDGSNAKSDTITKTNFPSKNFAYYSLQNQAILPANREPDGDKWDLLFTQYTTFLPTPYNVTGVLHNRGVQAVKVSNLADKATFRNWMAEPMTPAINTLGYNWKAFNGSAYDIKDSTVYFVKSVPGDIWKIIFTGFSMIDGKMSFSKEKIVPANINDINNQRVASIALYPNPSNGQPVTVVYDIENGVNQVQLMVTDVTGKLLYNTMLDNNRGLHQHQLPTQSFNAGVYIVSVITESGRTQQKLVIQ